MAAPNTKGPGSRKSNSRNPKDWSDYEFADIKLSDADKDHFKMLSEEETTELTDCVATLLEGEYKITFTGDKRNDCVICSVTSRDPTDVNFGYVLTSRSSNWYEALLLSAFKHLYLCDGGNWPKEKRVTNWG